MRSLTAALMSSIRQTSIFLAEFYKDQGDIPRAKGHAELAKLRSHQMIDVETGDYITKDENTKWQYKPCYDRAVAFLSTL